MTNRENAMAILNYEKYDRLPLVHFGYWVETIQKWQAEGHIPKDVKIENNDNGEFNRKLSADFGFDFVWNPILGTNNSISPGFESRVLEELEDGHQKMLQHDGAIVLVKPGLVSIPAEIDHTLKDRASWESEYVPKLQWFEERVNAKLLKDTLARTDEFDMPMGFHAGSILGTVRNWLGIENLSYLYLDDEDLYVEIIETCGALMQRCLETALKSGIVPDYMHYWEDICYKNGPLVTPRVFDEICGPIYKKMTDTVKAVGTKIISLDCDGLIDSLIPTWFNNGINTMFPIEHGTWEASLTPWREKYGKELRGVGGMNKNVFGFDYAAVDKEIERLRPIIELGGYIPCPDHRIPPEAIWENVQYYCEQMRKIFG